MDSTSPSTPAAVPAKVATFERLLATSFRTEARLRGYEEFQGERLAQVEVRPGRATARAGAAAEHEARLLWDPQAGPDRVRAGCSCPGFAARGPCEHIWALVLELDERDVKPPSGEPGAAPQERAPEWRRRLEELAAAPQDVDEGPWAGVEGDSGRLRFEVELERSRECERLVLRTLHQRRLRSGEFGAGRPLALAEREGLEPGDALDRRVLARLRGAERVATPGALRANDEHVLTPELARELAPLLARKGRLFLSDGGETPLAFDPKPAWRFAVEVRRELAAGEVVLTGVLERDEERMALAAPVLVLATEGLVLTRETLARLDAADAPALLEGLREGGPLRAPLEAEPELVERLVARCGRVQVHAPALEWAEEVEPQPHLVVSGEAAEDAPGALLECRIEFDYDGARVAPSDVRRALPRPGDGRLVRRRMGSERAALARFVEAGGRRARGGPAEGEISVRELPALVRELVGAGWHVEALGRIWRRAAGELSLRVRTQLDWLELSGTLGFDGQAAELPELLRAAREKREGVPLADGSYGLMPHKVRELLGLLDGLGRRGEEGLRLSRDQGWLLDALLAGEAELQGDAAFLERRERLAGFSGVKLREEPESFRGTLRPYQRQGLSWILSMAELGLGGCLADDMGLGKTVQVLAALETLRRERDARGEAPLPALVVAPRSLVFNWLDEAARFAPELRVLDYTGTERVARRERLGAADLVVTTYGTLRRDALLLSRQRFGHVVLDEAQAIKNAASQASKSARLLTAEHRLALSGTPIENHLGELWSLFEFLNPGLLGRSTAFRSYVAARREEDGEERLETLADALRPYFLRRTKRQVLHDLPEKSEQTIQCELGRRQRAEYDELRAHYRARVLESLEQMDLEGSRMIVLEALLRLRQAACHPGLIDPARRDEGSAKVDTLVSMLEELVAEGHRALVFSQFTTLLGIVRARLDERGIAHQYLDGRTRDRKALVDAFQSGEGAPVFLISLKAGGAGLNLTAADYVFLLDPWWNPAVEAQAIDRAHRYGRTRPVLAYRLIAHDTVEERVVELQARKRELAEAILGGRGGSVADLTKDDLEELLS